MPENVWLGVSITKDLEMDTRLLPLKIAEAEKKFISFEPLLEEIVLPAGKRAILYDGRFTSGVDFSGIDWIIVGRLTGHGRKLDPKPTWVEAIAIESGKARIPIFMKDNLASIWPGVLLQEFPK
jgi:protein gp37